MIEPSDRDSKAVVRDSYNRISEAYRGDSVSRDRGYFRWLEELTPLLQPGDPVLDLGCGCGIPVAQELARAFTVTGVDISEVQIERARALVPQATFLCGDFMSVDFAPQSFTAVVSFYAIIHVPLPEQRPLFDRIFTWLRP
ncbi:MAG: methyltransferase domain-containing protein, partial [Chloroflexota bacterium]